jgi:predicted amidophosphoribosyltransferase
MAIEHARICGACERESPAWATRCPCCGSLSLIHRITIVPPAAPVPTVAESKPARKKAFRPRIAAAGREAARQGASLYRERSSP